MKINLLEPLGVEEPLILRYAEMIAELGHEFEYYDVKTTDPEALVKRSLGADIIMIANTPYPIEAILRNPALKLINIAFTGVDHVPVEAARSQGIEICNASGYSDVSVAEHVIGLVLDLYRHIATGEREIRLGQTARIGREIRGKTVGIIGTGKIGLETARLFHAFGARTVGYSRSRREEAIALGIEYLELDELLGCSDIVSLHLPSNSDTEGFIGREHLSLMKPSALLINCARGKVVDNAALAEALNAGRIAGAGVDVFDMEPPIPEDYPLLHARNTVLSPHVAYLTEEAMVRRAHIAFENTLAYLRGERQNMV